MTERQQDSNPTLHTVRQTTYSGQEFHIYARDYNQAQEWFQKKILSRGDTPGMTETEIGNADSAFLQKTLDIRSDEPVYSAGGVDPLKDLLTKGYDTDSSCYIFSRVDVSSSEATVPAASLEEALQLAASGTVDFSDGAELGAELRQDVYSCDEYTCAVVDGLTVPFRTEEDLTRALERQYPKGMTVVLENECIQNLIAYSTHDNENGEYITLKGMIDAVGSSMPGANGRLDAKLVLTPDQYDLLNACDSTYWSSELSDLGWESGDNATSMMLATEDSFKDSRIETPVCPDMLQALVIEGRPYHDIMQIVGKHHMTDDDALLHYFNLQLLDSQPEWKKQLAEKMVAEDVNRYFVRKVAPAIAEKKKMYHETQELVARENGYHDAAEWNRDVQWTRNPSPELAQKLYRTAERWRELYLPHEKKCEQAFALFERYKTELVAGFIRRFDRRADTALSEAKVIRQAGGNLAVRCKLDGRQLTGSTLSTAEARALVDAANKQPLIRDLAVRHFSQDIADSLQQAKRQGIKM